MAHIEETLRISYPKRCYGRNVGTCASWKMGKAKRTAFILDWLPAFSFRHGRTSALWSEIGIPSYLLPKAKKNMLNGHYLTLDVGL
jgi:hypothetical protein